MGVSAKGKDASTERLANEWEAVSAKCADLAAVLPANKLDWTPVEGCRSYGDILRHVAFWNQYVAATLKGEAFDSAPNAVAASKYATKAGVLRILRQSLNDVSDALRGGSVLSPAKTAELVAAFREHNSEHYGQLTVLCRMLGEIPPASLA